MLAALSAIVFAAGLVTYAATDHEAPGTSAESEKHLASITTEYKGAGSRDFR